MPVRLAVPQIEDRLSRDRAQLAAYKEAIAEVEAEGMDPCQVYSLARFVEERIALLTRVREARLPSEQARPAGEEPSWH